MGGDERHVGGDRTGGPQPSQPASDGRGGQADPFGQLVRGLEVVLLHERQQLPVEAVELLPQNCFP
jgi:hypothetical protein